MIARQAQIIADIGAAGNPALRVGTRLCRRAAARNR
jgi:hypothetical protein